MTLERFKFSAIHNLRITNCDYSDSEGLVIPEKIMDLADIHDGQEIILTKIGAGNWKNRIRTFAIKGSDDKVTVRGSLAHFLNIGDLTCIIAEAYLDETEMHQYNNDQLSIFDLGFDPMTNKDNTICTLDLQYANSKHRNIQYNTSEFIEQKKKRQNIKKVFSKSIILGLKVNNTHPDCLQGSAEIPASVMNFAGIREYKSVSVYNASDGGCADTYAVPMPEGVVMTTGAMASFAPLGSIVNVVSYVISTHKVDRTTVLTDGISVCE